MLVMVLANRLPPSRRERLYEAERDPFEEKGHDVPLIAPPLCRPAVN